MTHVLYATVSRLPHRRRHTSLADEHLPSEQAAGSNPAALGETLDPYGDFWQTPPSGCGIMVVPMLWAHVQARSIRATQTRLSVPVK